MHISKHKKGNSMSTTLLEAVNTNGSFSDFSTNYLSTGTTSTGADLSSTTTTTSGAMILNGYSSTCPTYWYQYPWYQYPNYTYTYHTCSCDGNKTEQAYKIIRALMKAKVIKIQALSVFFTTMDAILETL
jgi:hypothetical protein